MVDGPRVALKGILTTAMGTKFDVSTIYLSPDLEAGRTVAFGRVSDELIHMLAGANRLMLGPPGGATPLIGRTG